MPRRTFALVLLLVLAFHVLNAVAVAQEPLVAASAGGGVEQGGGGHAWFVVQPRSGVEARPALYHHAADMNGPYFGRALTLSQAPEAMAAWGARVWLVHPVAVVGGSLRREVFTLEAVRDPTTGLYTTVPASRLALVQPLPPSGELAGFAATEQGPVALLAGVPANEAPETDDAQRGMRLLQLRGGRWIDIALPHELKPTAALHLGAGGERGERLTILASEEGTGSAGLYRREVGGEWSRHELPLRAEQVHSMTAHEGRLAVVRDGDEARQVQVAYLRRGAVLPLATVQVGSDEWAVLAMRGGFRLLMQSARGDVSIRSIDPITGEAGEPVMMRVQPVASARLWHMGLMLFVAVLAVLIVILVRPGARGPVRLPNDTAPLPASARLLAVVADLFPGGLVAVLVLRVSPGELLRLPIATDSLEHSAPFLLMIAVAAMHSTLTELLKQTTLGKALVGAKIVAQDGVKPGAASVLLRNVLKVMILLVPPLAIFALLSPQLQGFNDLLARTVVVRVVGRDEEEKKR